MTATFGRLALHTWTIDTTPLDVALKAARDAGFDAVELRRIDFKRCYDRGLSNDQVLDIVRAGAIPVCTLGCEYGWLFATGDESARLFDVLRQTCENAVALKCPQIMCAPGPHVGLKSMAIDNLKRAGDMVGEFGLTLAIEFNSQHDVINCIAVLREIVHAAGRANVGMLLDAYHLHRSGAGGRGFASVDPADIAAFQYSDAPPAPVSAGVKRPTDRLAPGKGVVRWTEVLQLLLEKNFAGHLSYEAPNPDLWARSPFEVAREGVEATRTLIKQALAMPSSALV
jgi:sugar phosphate isomerase/epimerase